MPKCKPVSSIGHKRGTKLLKFTQAPCRNPGTLPQANQMLKTGLRWSLDLVCVAEVWSPCFQGPWSHSCPTHQVFGSLPIATGLPFIKSLCHTGTGQQKMCPH